MKLKRFTQINNSGNFFLIAFLTAFIFFAFVNYSFAFPIEGEGCPDGTLCGGFCCLAGETCDGSVCVPAEPPPDPLPNGAIRYQNYGIGCSTPAVGGGGCGESCSGGVNIPTNDCTISLSSGGVSIDDEGSISIGGWSTGNYGCSCNCNSQTGSGCANFFSGPGNIPFSPGSSVSASANARNDCKANGYGVWGGISATVTKSYADCNTGYHCDRSSGSVQCVSDNPCPAQGVNDYYGCSGSVPTNTLADTSKTCQLVGELCYQCVYGWSSAQNRCKTSADVNTCLGYDGVTQYSVGSTEACCVGGGSTPCGACQGTRNCQSGSIWSSCSGQTGCTPSSTEVCCGGGTQTCTSSCALGGCSGGSPSTEICTDGIDNDCDGSSDCSDPECSLNPACSSCSCGSWTNQGCGLGGCPANDMYQTRTCNPIGCFPQSNCDSANPSCAVAENCDNNADDDFDGYIDEGDSDCAFSLSLTPLTVAPSGSVSASITRVIPSGTVITVSRDACAGNGGIAACTITGPSLDCASTFTAPSSAATYTYYACLGQNSPSRSLTVGTSNDHCSLSSTHSGSDSGNGIYAHIYDPGPKTYSVTNCGNKASDDTDGSSTAYNVTGTVTDYKACTSGACTGTLYTDYCTGTSLTEYGASGTTYTSSNFNCNNYNYVGCVFNRWTSKAFGCSGGVCSDAAADDSSGGTDTDGDLVDSQCEDSLCDNANGVCNTAVSGKCIAKTATETTCNDNLDNDCDGAKDCSDQDCNGVNGCLYCATAADCPQSSCVAESCVANVCTLVNRPACDTTECASGQFCDVSGGNCVDADSSRLVCMNCVTDTTIGQWNWTTGVLQDGGKAYSNNSNVFYSLFSTDSNACSINSGGTCFNTTSVNAGHQRPLTTGNCCGDDPNEYFKYDYYGGECVSSVNDCVWSTGDAQASNSGNARYWCNKGNWSECNGPSTIGKKHGSAYCVGTGSEWVLDPEPENTYSDNACEDNLDNDADGLIDCADSDCNGWIYGTALDRDTLAVIESATIESRISGVPQGSDNTNSMGIYNLTNMACGTYTLTASHPDYAPEIAEGISVNPGLPVSRNFFLAPEASCEADCTTAFDNIVHSECDGVNGCSFCDAQSQSVCDYSQPGWLRDYNSTHYVACASGCPQVKVEVKANIACGKDNLVKVTSIAMYNGVPVKLIVATCG